MLEIAIVIAIVGSAVAAIWDLKTTEVPDEVPYLMAAFGGFLWFIAFVDGDAMPFVVSLAVGTAVLVFGLVLYNHGKWGGADAWIFASILYLVPVYNGRLFVVDYLSNLVWVSFAFTVVYAFALGLKHPDIVRRFLPADLIENAPAILGIPVAVAGIFTLAAQAMAPGAVFPWAVMAGLLFAFMVFWRYAKIIETRIFTRRIPSSQLRAGDVLSSMIWRGLTSAEVEKIKKSRKRVTIKEGMRFVPVFFITLVATLLWGNAMFYIVNMA